MFTVKWSSATGVLEEAGGDADEAARAPQVWGAGAGGRLALPMVTAGDEGPAAR